MSACGLTHDPEPYLQSGMMASGQSAVWWGKNKFRPRDGHCQDEACYLAVEAKA